nr:hypothetical protein [Streptomyces sp. MW-W600-10]
MHDPGHRDQDVERPGGLYSRPDLVAVGDVQGVRTGGAARVGDPVVRPAQARLVTVRAVHRGSGCREQQGARPPDTARRTRDERGAAREVVRGEGHDGTVRPGLTGRQLGRRA